MEKNNIENRSLEIKPKSRTKKVLISLLLVIIVAITIFIMYEIATVNNTYYIGEKNLQIPIFVYHDIVENESQVEYDYMQTTANTFEKQITGLMKLGYKPISYEDLVEYKNGNKPISKWSFLITFDDGYSGVYKYAYEIAKKYNIPMTSFEISDKVGDDGYYTWDEAKEMKESGLISIYLHGYTHAEYDKKTLEELLSEINMAYEDLQNELEDKDILKVFTYPYGLSTNEGRAILAKEGYVQNLTDNRINTSNKLELSELHRSYPLDDSVFKILLKIQYRAIRYK